MRLVSAQTVLDIMGVQQGGSSAEASANIALDLSYSLIESLLETVFKQNSYLDVFSPTTSDTELRLSSMFVSLDDGVVIYESEYSSPITAIGQGVVVPATDYVVDYGKGVVTLLKPPKAGPYALAVAFVAGFPVGTTPMVLNPAKTPQWLRAVATSAAVHVMNTHPSTPANRKASQTASAVSTILNRYVHGLLSPHFRGRAGYLFPVATYSDV